MGCQLRVCLGILVQLFVAILSMAKTQLVVEMHSNRYLLDASQLQLMLFVFFTKLFVLIVDHNMCIMELPLNQD